MSRSRCAPPSSRSDRRPRSPARSVSWSRPAAWPSPSKTATCARSPRSSASPPARGGDRDFTDWRQRARPLGRLDLVPQAPRLEGARPVAPPPASGDGQKRASGTAAPSARRPTATPPIVRSGGHAAGRQIRLGTTPTMRADAGHARRRGAQGARRVPGRHRQRQDHAGPQHHRAAARARRLRAPGRSQGRPRSLRQRRRGGTRSRRIPKPPAARPPCAPASTSTSTRPATPAAGRCASP